MGYTVITLGLTKHFTKSSQEHVIILSPFHIFPLYRVLEQNLNYSSGFQFLPVLHYVSVTSHIPHLPFAQFSFPILTSVPNFISKADRTVRAGCISHHLLHINKVVSKFSFCAPSTSHQAAICRLSNLSG